MKFTVYLYYTKFSWEDRGIFRIFSTQVGDDQYSVFVGERVVEVDVPDNVDFDPVTREIEVLSAQRDEIRIEAERRAAEIEAKISKLQK